MGSSASAIDHTRPFVDGVGNVGFYLKLPCFDGRPSVLKTLFVAASPGARLNFRLTPAARRLMTLAVEEEPA